MLQINNYFEKSTSIFIWRNNGGIQIIALCDYAAEFERMTKNNNSENVMKWKQNKETMAQGSCKKIENVNL